MGNCPGGNSPRENCPRTLISTAVAVIKFATNKKFICERANIRIFLSSLNIQAWFTIVCVLFQQSARAYISVYAFGNNNKNPYFLKKINNLFCEEIIFWI